MDLLVASAASSTAKTMTMLDCGPFHCCIEQVPAACSLTIWSNVGNEYSPLK